MGACGSASKQDSKQDKEISKYLKDEKKKMDEEVKLLLLGAGESGKKYNSKTDENSSLGRIFSR